MSKAYSNKALPAGTIIREWRIEDVLGVGGFGIVYKGRGIYFGELVAIKEYFPSSIAERDSEDTVVPIGSDVEEVHALGLKKFVEEAKLLWNLSTPSRHPNIVSVRSLFEIHGTAYMIMDFEDGVSLSKLLREGRRFNERSLWNIFQPIAEGLDRAHRVGVLHRDIKPPNILITDDNRPVLIDFGSARFAAAEATSTSVTFHTPPYAAVEQYVKTYEQGPWTDIYALAVVLYECVTGEKPPEVLERMHGGLGTPLADGHWPGFGKRFLQAIDSGMTIKPSERPQSIREWLALFGKKNVVEPEGESDAPTRFFSSEVTTKEITPVAPPAPGFDQTEIPETQVPSDPKDAQFKRAGEETGAKKKKKGDAAAVAVAAAEVAEPVKSEPAKPEPTAKDKKPPQAKDAKDGKGQGKKPPIAWLAGGGALALVVAGLAGSGVFSGGSGNDVNAEAPAAAPVAAVEIGGVEDLAPALKALADDARNGGAPATAVNDLVTAGADLDKQMAALRPIMGDSTKAAAATTQADAMKRAATTANVAFSNALLRDAESRAGRASAGVTGPAVGRMQAALAELRTSVETSAGATDPEQAINAARDALAKSQAFAATLPAVYNQQAAAKRTTVAPPPVPGTKPTTVVTSVATPTQPEEVTRTPTTSSSTAGVSSAKMAQFNGIISSGRSLAKQVIRMGSSGNAQQKANATLAKNYDSYLANLADSMRGAKNDAEADRLIKQANQTKAYIVFLNKQSSGQ